MFVVRLLPFHAFAKNLLIKTTYLQKVDANQRTLIVESKIGSEDKEQTQSTFAYLYIAHRQFVAVLTVRKRLYLKLRNCILEVN